MLVIIMMVPGATLVQLTIIQGNTPMARYIVYPHPSASFLLSHYLHQGGVVSVGSSRMDFRHKLTQVVVS